jgi:hypothetical protein
MRQDILDRLRDAHSLVHVGELALAFVKDVLSRPVEELADPERLAGAIRDSVIALTASEASAARMAARLESARQGVAASAGPIGDLVPEALSTGARALARLSARPSRETILKLLDRPPIRLLLRAQLIEALAAFGRKAASPVVESSIARGLGGISKRALGHISLAPHPLARVANAMSHEFERQVEKRATDFADTAMAGILVGIAEQATDARWAEEQAAVRTAVLDGLLELTGAEFVSILPGDAAAQVDAIWAALGAWAKDADFVRDVEGALRFALAADAKRPLGDVLDEFGLREPVERHAAAALERIIARFVASEPFERWLTRLLAEEQS